MVVGVLKIVVEVVVDALEVDSFIVSDCGTMYNDAWKSTYRNIPIRDRIMTR